MFVIGHKHSKKTKRKLSIAKLGDRNPMKRLNVREKMIKSKTGKPTAKRGKSYPKIWKLYNLPVLEETFWSYLAGMIDGEGSIEFPSSNKTGISFPRVAVANTNEEVLLWIKNRLVGGNVYLRKINNKKLKPCYVLYFQSHNLCLAVLEKTLSYLHIKKEKAIEVILMIKSKI